MSVNRWDTIDNNDVFNTAWRKLVLDKTMEGAEGIPANIQAQWWTTGRMLAVLSHRFHIQFRHVSHPSAEREQNIRLTEQVEKHLRHLVWISEKRDQRYTVASSEPVLSHVSFEGMLFFALSRHDPDSEKALAAPVLNYLRQHVFEWSGCSGGDIGELAAQILILVAVDYVKLKKFLDESDLACKYDQIEKTLKQLHDNGRLFTADLRNKVNHVITVRELIEGLLADTGLALLSACSKEEAKRFLVDMEQYKMYLTHFLQTSSGTAKRQECLGPMAQRGLGLLLRPGATAVDMIVPVFRDAGPKDNDNNINDDRERRYMIQIQVKNGQSSTPLSDLWAAMEKVPMDDPPAQKKTNVESDATDMSVQIPADQVAGQSSALSKNDSILNMVIDFSYGTGKPKRMVEVQEGLRLRGAKGGVGPQSWRFAVRGVSGEVLRPMRGCEDDWKSFLNCAVTHEKGIREMNTSDLSPFLFEEVEEDEA